jgi:hypothetical protein
MSGKIKKAENKKTGKKIAKEIKTWRDLAEKAKTHKAL